MDKKIIALSLIIMICVAIGVGAKWYKHKDYVSVKSQPTEIKPIKIEPTKGKPFAKMILNDRGTISYLPAGTLNKQPIKVGKIKIMGLRVEDNRIIVNQKIDYQGYKGVRVILVDGDNYRPRDSFLSHDSPSKTYDFAYQINLLADKRRGLPPLNLSNVNTIIFENLGECVAVPFDGGKNQ